MLVTLLVAGCEEVNTTTNPSEPDPGYEVVSTIPPIGVFNHLDHHPESGTGYLCADYMGIVEMDFSSPGYPVIQSILNNDMIGSALSCRCSVVSGYIYVETLQSEQYNKAIRMFRLDEILNQNYSILDVGSPPVEKFEVVEFCRDSSGTIITDSLNFYIADLAKYSIFHKTSAVHGSGWWFMETDYWSYD